MHDESEFGGLEESEVQLEDDAHAFDSQSFFLACMNALLLCVDDVEAAGSAPALRCCKIFARGSSTSSSDDVSGKSGST